MTAVPDDLQRLLAEEPFVRRLAQQLVAGDADDVVQQAWLRVLAAKPRLLREPRHWLASVVRRIVADHGRGERHRRDRERVAAGTGERLVPSSSELVEGEERRRELIAAVDALPAPLRTVVLLRWYDGEPPRRIAARLGLPVSTVCNRLHTALQVLRKRLDARHGERRAWLLPLVPFADLPRTLPWRELLLPNAALAAGAIVTTKTKLGLAAAAVVAAALWISWPALHDGAAAAPGTTTSARAETAAAPGASTRVTEPQPAAPAPRELAPPAAAPAAASATGSVLVHVRFADEPRAVRDVVTRLRRSTPFDRGQEAIAATDANGDARFDAVAPGPVRVRAAQNQYAAAAGVVEAGKTIELTLDLTDSLTVTGVVVDPHGTPVGGALLEVSMPAIASEPGLPGVSAADGTFTLRGCPTETVIGARAAGFGASQLQFVHGKPGATEHVRIELRPNGGSVAGHVLDRDGRPVAGASVLVGDGSRESILGPSQPPLPAGATSDSDGRFHAVGVAQGAQRVQGIAHGFAPWSGTCDVVAGATAAVRIVLEPGLTCRGIVRGDDGRPLPDIRVAFGEYPDFGRRTTHSAADGTFELDGLPAGEHTLTAAHRLHGKGSTIVRGAAGDVVACEITVTSGIVLRGRVVDDSGAPVANVQLQVEGLGSERLTWGPYAISDDAGRFRVPNVPAGARLAIRIAHRDFAPFALRDVDPNAGEVELRLQRHTGPRATIRGRVLRPDGTPAAGEEVGVTRMDVVLPAETVDTAADGTFAFAVAPGTWVVRASGRTHPSLRAGPQVLTAGAPWDIGAMQLTRGGRLVVPTDVGGTTKLFVVDRDAQHVDALRAPMAGLPTPVPPFRSSLLNPGDYRLLVQGENVAAAALPFTIRDGEDTTLDVKPAAGVRQRFEVRAAVGAELPRFTQLRIDRGGELVLRVSAAVGDGSGVLAATAWLAPGDYTVTPARGGAVAEPFSVGAAEGDVVRVTMR